MNTEVELLTEGHFSSSSARKRPGFSPPTLSDCLRFNLCHIFPLGRRGSGSHFRLKDYKLCFKFSSSSSREIRQRKGRTISGADQRLKPVDILATSQIMYHKSRFTPVFQQHSCNMINISSNISDHQIVAHKY